MYLADDAAAHDERAEIVGFRADHFLGRIFLRAEHGDKGSLCSSLQINQEIALRTI